MESQNRKNKFLRTAFLISALFVFIFGFSCNSAKAEDSAPLPTVQLNSELLNGELPTVVRGFEYKEFKITKSVEHIVFMTDYKPANLLSNKEILPKTSFLQNSKFVYNVNAPKKHWGLITTIY